MLRFHAGRGRGGRSFIELIFVLVVIAAAGSYFVPRYLGATDALQPKTDASTLSGAKDISCRTNLNVLRQAVVTKRTAGANPRSLDEAGAAGDAKCPSGGEEYIYTPETGSVRCPHKGHEAF